MNFLPLPPDQHAAFYAAFEGPKTFLQSAKWGQFRATVGEENLVYGAYDTNKKLVGVAQAQVISARRGRIFLCAHGPLLTDEAALFPFLDSLKSAAKTHKCDLLRVTPLLPKESAAAFADNGFRPAAPYMVNPSRTLTVDAQLAEEDLIKQMKKSMRYEVRQIEKQGVTVRAGGVELFDAFWALHAATVARQSFTPFAKEKTLKQFAAFGDDMRLFVADHAGAPQAASIIIYDDAAGYYHQGASLRTKAPVAHATLMAAIGHARDRGCSTFNFWGLSEAENRAHPWWGLSRFKRGFGGTEHEYVHAQDFPLTWKYHLCRFIEARRRKKRGY